MSDHDAPSTDDAPTEGDGGTMAEVNHVHPDTSETFWAVYRRGPAATDGGAERARRYSRGSRGSGAGRGSEPRRGDGRRRARRNGVGGADGDDPSLADVDHEPPYPEPNDVWTRGFKRPSGVGSDE